MNEDFVMNLSPQQLANRFDLLAADAKEYAIFLIGQDGRLICWNPGAERLFGYQSNEIVGQHFSRFFSPEDIRNGQPEHELKTALADGRAGSVRWQVRKDGTRFWCRATVTPLRDEHKQVRSFARVMHDLTDSQAQDAQKKRGDDLAEANRSKEEFMALLSHELRNPLSPILNALSILRQMRTDDPIIEQAGNIINRQVIQMVRLVDDLLDISRITKGKLRLTKEKLELRFVANRAAESARPLMDALKHDFSVSLPTEPIWVEADPARLEQIVVNLLNNAAKYTDAGGLVRMSVQQEGADAVIRVRDNGVGIARRCCRVSSICSRKQRAHSAGRTAGWGSDWPWCVPWWKCRAVGCRHGAVVLARAANSRSSCRRCPTRPGTGRRRSSSRASKANAACVSSWWKTTSIPPTA